MPGPTNTTARLRSGLTHAALLVFGLGTGLAIAELVVRALDLEPHRLRGKRYLVASDALSYHCYPSNPHGEMSALPDTSQGRWRLLTSSLTELPLTSAGQTPWCVEDRLSDQNLRDRHYDPAAGGKTRIAMVGDSFVRGEGVPVERGLPRQVETLLGADRYEVANVGFVGAGTGNEVITVGEAMSRLNVSRVLLVFVPND